MALLHRWKSLLNAFEVCEQQFGFDDLCVVNRIDTAVNVHHVGILEASQYVENRIDLADVSEELVAESFAFAGARTSPAMSTNSNCVGMIAAEPEMDASFSNLSSGTATRPMFGSMVQNG